MRYKFSKYRPGSLLTSSLIVAVSILQIGHYAYAAVCGPYENATELAKVYSSQHLCGTCSGQQNNQDYCGVLNNMLDVNRLASNLSPVSPVYIPHRGIWGGIGAEGPAENSMGALKKAKEQGYRIVEIDAMVGSKTKQSSDGRHYNGTQVKMSHYFDMYAYGGESGKAPRVVSDLSSYKMRKRNGNLSTDDDDQIASIRDAIIYAHDNKIMLTIDPKNPPDNQKNNTAENEYAEIILSALITAENIDALGYITIKSELTPLEIHEALVNSGSYPSGKTLEYWSNKVLWSPILNKSAKGTLEDVENLMVAWGAGSSCGSVNRCIDKGAFMTFEVQVYNTEHWTNKSFNSKGISANNIIDYVEKYTSHNFVSRRATMWSVDPMSSLGTLGREYNWKFIGNEIDKTDPSKDDLRSDPIFILTRDGALRSAIITDRPDVYRSILD